MESVQSTGVSLKGTYASRSHGVAALLGAVPIVALEVARWGWLPWRATWVAVLFLGPGQVFAQLLHPFVPQGDPWEGEEFLWIVDAAVNAVLYMAAWHVFKTRSDRPWRWWLLVAALVLWSIVSFYGALIGLAFMVP